jgi:hypothetical protein
VRTFTARARYAPCKAAWCGPCYKPTSHLKFPVKTQVDDDGKEILDPGEETQFVEARAGDHLMTPFQCDTCHFRNFMGRSPVMTNLPGKEILGFIRQANLDSFWCRVKSTVAAHMRKGCVWK